jgi:O-antigen ligase
MTELPTSTSGSRWSDWRKLLRLPHRDDPRYGVVFLITLAVPLIFIPTLFEGYETVKFPLLLVLTGAGWLLLMWRRRTIQVDRVVLFSSLALIVWFAVATIFSIDPVNSLVGLYTRYTSSLLFCVCWVLFMILASSVLRGEEDRTNTLLRVLVFDAVAIAIFGIFQYFDLIYYSGVNAAPRPIIPSFIGNQNFSAMFLVGVVPAIAVLFTKVTDIRSKALYAASGAVIIWAIVLSGSRGALVGLVVELVVMLGLALWQRYQKSYLLLTLAGLAVTVLLFTGFFALTRAGNLSGSLKASDLTIQTRFLVWSDSIDMIKRLPVVGSGPANFFIAFKQIGNTALSGNERFDDAHNLFLNIGTAVGIPGLIIFLFLLGYVLYRSWSSIKQRSGLALFSLAALLGFLAAACFNPVSVPNWLILGLLIVFGTEATAKKITLHRLWQVSGIVVAVVLMVISVLFMSSEVLTNYGTKDYRHEEYHSSLQLLNIARLLNPTNTTARTFWLGSRIRQGQNPEVIDADIQKLVRLHQRSSGIYKSASDLYYILYRTTQEEHYRDVMSDMLEKAASREPDFGSLYGSIAYTYYKAGLPERAQSYLHRQLSLPDSEQYIYSWILLSKIYQEQGRKEQSIFALTKAFRNSPETLVVKGLLEQLKTTPDITKVNFPVFFPEIDIE